MKDKQELLEDFIFWLSSKEDVYYAFDNSEEVIQEYLKMVENNLKTEK